MSHQKIMTFARECEFCGRNFEARSPQAKFCCDACRLRWYRFKQRVPDAATRAERAINELVWLLEQQCTAEDSWNKLANLQASLARVIDAKANAALNNGE